MKRVYSQKGGTSCFVYALANCYSYLGMKQDKNFVHLFHDTVAECKNGPLIEKQRAIKEFGLDRYLNETDHATDIKGCGGIVAIMHPIFNLHAVFVAPIDDNSCIVYNSWLGPAEMRIGWDELFRFTKHRATCHYYLREKFWVKEEPRK